MASIHKTGSGYRVRWRDPTGRMKSRSFKLRRDADAFGVKVEHEMRSRVYVDPDRGRMLVADWTPEMMAHRLNLRPSTLTRDWSVLRSLVLPAFGARRLDQVRPLDVQRWVADLAASKAPTTVRKAAELLGKVFESAVAAELIPRSPCVGISLPKMERTEMRALTVEEIRRLVDGTPPRYQALVLAAVHTGLRWGELAALHRGRLDLEAGVLAVTENLAEVQGHLLIGPPKTSASRRSVSIPRFLAPILEQQVLNFPTKDGRVFAGSSGGLLRRTNFRRRVWLPAVRESVGEPLRFHDLRHTHAALLIAEGVHPKAIQARLGHSSIRTTLDTYGHLYEGIDRAAADALDRIGPATVPQMFHLDDPKVVALPTRRG